MRRSKKGDLSIQMIVVAILALMVLAVIGYIFWDQISKAVKDYNTKREQYSNEQAIESKLNQQIGSVFIPFIPIFTTKWTKKRWKQFLGLSC